MAGSAGDLDGLSMEDTDRLMDTEAGTGRSPRHRTKRRDSHSPASIKDSLVGMLSSWLSRRFFSGIAVLFPLVVTVYVTWWFLRFFDNFFSPVYFALFGFHVFGLGFITSMVPRSPLCTLHCLAQCGEHMCSPITEKFSTMLRSAFQVFIFMTGVFVSSWIGGIFLSIGEWIIKKLPLIKHIYSAAKQVTAGLNPENAEAKSFRECVMIKHPRHGEYAIGFITGETLLRLPQGDKKLFSIYVPTNHVYVGDIFLMGEEEILKPKLSVREGLEVVVSLGMALPPVL